VTITPDAQYRITITEELRWDPYPPFTLHLVAGFAFAVEGGISGIRNDGCRVGQLDLSRVVLQVPGLTNCTIGGFTRLYCDLSPPTGCDNSLQFEISGKFPRVGTTESTQIKIYILGSNCDGSSGRSIYNATATWIGFKAIGDGGIDG
jgi:hypothetical protein